jgi:hypothetical protein
MTTFAPPLDRTRSEITGGRTHRAAIWIWQCAASSTLCLDDGVTDLEENVRLEMAPPSRARLNNLALIANFALRHALEIFPPVHIRSGPNACRAV